jgi:hypothetical protein
VAAKKRKKFDFRRMIKNPRLDQRGEADDRAGQKTEVEETAGVRLTKDFSESLSPVAWEEDGGTGDRKMGGGERESDIVTERNYMFEAGKETLYPTLTVFDGEAKEESIATKMKWNLASGLVRKMGDWTYEIAPGDKKTMNYAQIRRTKPDGETEFWHKDRKRGKEITEKDGIKTVKEWFVSGPAATATRKVTQIENGAKRIIYKASFDANGRPIKQTWLNKYKIQYVYDRLGEIVRITRTDLGDISNTEDEAVGITIIPVDGYANSKSESREN